MPTLTVVSKKDGTTEQFSYEPGTSLRYILDVLDIPVRTGCMGLGACGLCRVRVLSGNVHGPLESEQAQLDEEELQQGVRLACMLMPTDDLHIEILAPARSAWRYYEHTGKRPERFLPHTASRKISEYRPYDAGKSYGVAIDVGTTNICLTLYDLTNGVLLTGRIGANPQMSHGSDVMSRLSFAVAEPKQAALLQKIVLEAIGHALWSIAIREGVALNRIARVTLAGNTAMLALLSGRNYELLVKPEYWMNSLDCLPQDTRSWCEVWGISSQVVIEVLPPLAGFIGSDLTAGIVTLGLVQGGPGSLFIDFGTNSEMALWDGQQLWVTAAAGGPAFEGSGISCGMPAEPSAICKVEPDGDAWKCSTIGGKKPRGLCGSGLVDSVAGLRVRGMLSEIGKFKCEVPKEGCVLCGDDAKIVITAKDIDALQHAKAGIGAGVDALLLKTGMGYGDLKRICVAGAFGAYLNIENAQKIGMLPVAENARVEHCGNSSLCGCEDMLLSTRAVELFQEVITKVKPINLAHQANFDELFMSNLFLAPRERVGHVPF